MIEKSRCTVELIGHYGSDLNFVNAARTSFNNESKEFTDDDAKLIEYLIRNAHTTPFEMSFIQFKIQAPIFVARQFMRHRTWSYNEVSLRYVDAPNEYYVPNAFRSVASNKKQGSGRDLELEKNDLVEKHYREAIEKAVHSYEFIQSLDVANEMARGVLPVSQMTTFVAGVDLHNLLHFLELRLDEHAQQEIRWLAADMYDLVQPLFPVTIAAWKNRVFDAKTFSGNELKMISEAISAYDFKNYTERDIRVLKEKMYVTK
jgi:thymidylate synthase (FAD)